MLESEYGIQWHCSSSRKATTRVDRKRIMGSNLLDLVSDDSSNGTKYVRGPHRGAMTCGWLSTPHGTEYRLNPSQCLQSTLLDPYAPETDKGSRCVAAPFSCLGWVEYLYLNMLQILNRFT